MTPPAPATDARDAAPADLPESLPATLRRNAPLVPLDTASGRALVAVIAILTFLAALCAGAAELVSASSAQWRSSVAREATVQVRPRQGRDIEADVARAAAIARALIVRPDLLLADEPTGNVDPSLARRLLRLFIELNRLGTSVVIATHDFSLMDQVDARRLVLGGGELHIDA